MQHFKCLRSGLPVQHLLDEIAAVPDAWNLNRGRQGKIKVQREAEAIPIRGLRKSAVAGRKKWDVHESRFTYISANFPRVRDCLQVLAQELDGKLARAKVVKLQPGARVYPHSDRGEYYKLRDRYHLVLASEPGNYLTCADERVWMRPGELWWFNNKLEHAAANESSGARIHFIFDLLPRANAYSSSAAMTPTMTPARK